jgi:hypothetical protein
MRENTAKRGAGEISGPKEATGEEKQTLTPTKRKRLLKQFGPCPPGYIYQELEQVLDLLYGLFSDLYTARELRQIMVSDPFDRSDAPRQMKLVEFTDWLEALVS